MKVNYISKHRQHQIHEEKRHVTTLHWLYGGATNIFSSSRSLSAFVRAEEHKCALVVIFIISNSIRQQLRADDFQIPPHRQAVTVCDLNQLCNNTA
jgi:hypothetical protein